MKRNFTFTNLTDKKTPEFIEKLCLHLGRSVLTPGNICCNIDKVEDEYQIVFSPALREIYGGANDGEQISSGFALNIRKFIRIFDKIPNYIFDCLNQKVVEHFLFEGSIKGNKVKIAILISPANNQVPTEKIYAEGPNAGKIEALVPKKES